MAPRDNNPLAPALAAGGALLLFISLILNWFSLDATIPGGGDQSIDVARPDTATLLLTAIAGGALLIALGRFRGFITGKAELLAGLGMGALLFILVNVIKKPQLLDLFQSAFDKAKALGGSNLPPGTDFGVGLGAGIWIALLGSLLLLGAGLTELLGGSGGPGGSPRGASAGSPPAPAAGGGGGGAGPLSATTVQPTAAAGGPPPPPDRSAGWKPDPYGQAQMRYWDGNAWTQHTN
ncbi:MAG: hypothetical protein QOG63_927 [Thermoleophilaceae bacterium]|jgi:hypothetical protein|nr:hypothetical protein [Thermoleophilaceae bacterium]